MGYLEDEVKRLQGIIANIESRVKALEERQFGQQAQKKPVEDNTVRMILIGPPGAGMWALAKTMDISGRCAHPAYRQGHSGPQDQGEVQLLPLGKLKHCESSREDEWIANRDI